MKSVWFGWVAAFGAVAIYAGNFVVNRYGIKATIGANDIVALRFGIAGLLLAPLLWRQGVRGLAGVGWKRGAILTVLAGPPFTLLMTWGLFFSSVAHGAAIVSGMIPIGAAIAIWLFTGVRVPAFKLLMFAVVVIGLFLVSVFPASNMPQAASGNQQVLFGDALFVVSGASWGLYAVLLRRWDLDPLPVTAVVSVLSLAYLPVYFWLLGPTVSGASLGSIALLAFYQGILGSIVALLLFSYSVNILGAAHASLVNATVPVFAALLAVPVLGELPAPAQWLGIALVVCGVVLAVRTPDAAPKIEKLEVA